jgi:outer membrane immunogenic protein
MRRSGLATLVAAGLVAAIPAGAADLGYRKAPPMFAPPPAFSWTGFYLGGQVGYSWGHDHTTEYLTSNGAFTGFEWRYNMSAAVGGLFAGANYQIGNAVLGAEADIEAAGNKGGFYDPPGAGDTRIRWQGTARGRLGYAADRVLVYGTGGFAFADISHTYIQVITPISETTAGIRTGWTVGGGIEYAITPNVLARAEYRYTDYGSYRYESRTAFPGLTGQQEPRLNTLRAGIAYKF